jgi:cell division septum initiation protein DivIVA
VKLKHQAIASLSLLLISADIATAQTISPSSSSSPAATESLSPAATLTERQRDEIEQILETQFQKSASVNDQIESVVSNRFNFMVGLLTVLTAILTLTPLLIGGFLLYVKGSIKDRIIEDYILEAQKQMEKEGITETIRAEVVKQLKQKVETELVNQLSAFKQKLVDYENSATTAQLNFNETIERLLSQVEATEKQIASAIISEEKIVTTIISSPEFISKIAESPDLNSKIAESIIRGKLQMEIISLLPKIVREELPKINPLPRMNLFKGKKLGEN